MDQYIGKMLDNRYEILERIGTGGMAIVYKAKCHRLNRLVAIKILKSDLAQNEEFRRRFNAESQAVAQLSHPNIVSVYDVSRGGDMEYIVMELIDGITLKQYMEKRAKLLVITLNIMDPEPSDTQGEPIVWLVFESGGVAALYDETGAGAIYRLEDPSAFEAALAANEDPAPALTLIESCIFPDVWDNVQQALEQ